MGLLNLTASLTKAGVDHSILWSEDFTDDLGGRRSADLARDRQARP
ncbi:MAG: hypothetical protein WKF83_14290 [Nocardioidaceae bacterium]